MDKRGIGVRFPAEAIDYLLNGVHIGSGTYSASYSIRIERFFPKGKAAIISTQC
jgi:hypothetical protein